MNLERRPISYQFALLLLSAAVQLSAQDAAAVMNRYVQVTGGADLYKRYNSIHLFYAVTHSDKTTENVDYFHMRDGKTLVETDTGKAVHDAGVSDGVAWKFTQGAGAQILSGKSAARFLAESIGFADDDWQLRYPGVSLLANAVINGASCRHVKLTRTDGSTLERFYDAKTGLLIREVSSEFDDAGNEQPTTTDFLRYDTFFGIRRATELRIKSGSESLSVVMNTVTYAPKAEAANFELPGDVLRAIAALHAKPGTSPSPVKLIDNLALTGDRGMRNF